MRIISVIGNIIMLIIVIEVVVHDKWPQDIYQQSIVIIFLLVPMLTIYTLSFHRIASHTGSWWILFIERKKLEEKAKLNKLKSTETKT